MFELTFDIIMNYCPDTYKAEAIARILPLLKEPQKLAKKVRRKRRWAKIKNLLNLKKYLNKRRSACSR